MDMRLRYICNVAYLQFEPKGRSILAKFDLCLSECCRVDGRQLFRASKPDLELCLFMLGLVLAMVIVPALAFMTAVVVMFAVVVGIALMVVALSTLSVVTGRCHSRKSNDNGEDYYQ